MREFNSKRNVAPYFRINGRLKCSFWIRERISPLSRIGDFASALRSQNGKISLLWILAFGFLKNINDLKRGLALIPADFRENALSFNKKGWNSNFPHTRKFPSVAQKCPRSLNLPFALTSESRFSRLCVRWEPFRSCKNSRKFRKLILNRCLSQTGHEMRECRCFVWLWHTQRSGVVEGFLRNFKLQ